MRSRLPGPPPDLASNKLLRTLASRRSWARIWIPQHDGTSSEKRRAKSQCGVPPTSSNTLVFVARGSFCECLQFANWLPRQMAEIARTVHEEHWQMTASIPTVRALRPIHAFSVEAITANGREKRKKKKKLAAIFKNSAPRLFRAAE